MAKTHEDLCGHRTVSGDALYIGEYPVHQKRSWMSARPGDLSSSPKGACPVMLLDPLFCRILICRRFRQGIEHLAAAQLRKIHLWVGACVRHDGAWFNNAYGFTPQGQTHTSTKDQPGQPRRGVFNVGNQLPVFELHTPNGMLPVGVQLCRELRYPEQWGWLARQGAKVILHLNNAVGTDRFQPVWRSHLVSRAAETQRYVLSANNAAQQQVSPTIAIAPSGHILGRESFRAGPVRRIELDIRQVSNWYLNQCRNDVVDIIKTET